MGEPRTLGESLASLEAEAREAADTELRRGAFAISLANATVPVGAAPIVGAGSSEMAVLARRISDTASVLGALGHLGSHIAGFECHRALGGNPSGMSYPATEALRELRTAVTRVEWAVALEEDVGTFLWATTRACQGVVEDTQRHLVRWMESIRWAHLSVMPSITSEDLDLAPSLAVGVGATAAAAAARVVHLRAADLGRPPPMLEERTSSPSAGLPVGEPPLSSKGLRNFVSYTAALMRQALQSGGVGIRADSLYQLLQAYGLPGPAAYRLVLERGRWLEQPGDGTMLIVPAPPP